MSDGQAYERGQPTPSSGVIQLVFANDAVYQQNVHHNWWRWISGAWAATAAPRYPSASGTTIPVATQIVDGQDKLWALSGGQAYENSAPTPSSGVILLLYDGGSVYQENVHHNWWRWSGSAWVATSADPRAGQPLAYVGTANDSVSIIDTGTNRVIGAVPIPFQPTFIAVAPDAKHVYVTGNDNLNYPGSYSVAVIATATEKVVATIPNLPQLAAGIVVSPDGSRVYVASGYTDIADTIVSVIDTATNTLRKNIAVPDSSIAPGGVVVSTDGKKLYVPIDQGHAVSGFVALIDTTTYNVSRIEVPTAALDQYQAAAIAPDNTKLYTTAFISSPSGSNVIAIFNPATGALIKKIPQVMTVSTFSPDGQQLYGLGLGGVAALEVSTDVARPAVPNLRGATSFALTPDGRHFYITDSTSSSVAVADTTTGTVSTVIGGLNAAGPIGLAPP